MSIKKEEQKVTFEKVWDKAKRNFSLGKDYLESETDEYIVFSPFNSALLLYLHEVLRGYNCLFNFTHCVCHSLDAFIYWYGGLYQYGRLKTFFIRKDIDLNLGAHWQKDQLVEFTGWIDSDDRNFLHFAHDVDNNLITGEYFHYEFKYAYNRKVTSRRKNDADFVNMLVSEVYDNLFAQYYANFNNLEKTLHNIIYE